MIDRAAKFSVVHAVASYLGEDVEETKARRYQPTRTPCAIFNTENDYFTATKSAKKQPKASPEWAWNAVQTEGYVKAAGWQIWQAE
jgi:hypothetical protein